MMITTTCEGDYRNWPFDTYYCDFYVVGSFPRFPFPSLSLPSRQPLSSSPRHKFDISWIKDQLIMETPWQRIEEFNLRPIMPAFEMYLNSRLRKQPQSGPI